MSKKLKFAVSVILCLGVGGLGSFFTSAAIPEWYQFLAKPSFNPPNWVFGPVWTVLYFLMAVALYLVWRSGLHKPEVRFAFWFFIVHLFFNLGWSFLFFGLRNPLLGLIEILFLWFMIAYSIVLFYRIDRAAGVLLVPYLLWVSFATLLNYNLYILNQ